MEENTIESSTARIFCLSDLHIDFKENFEWISTLSSTNFQNDTILLAGDITHDFELLAKGLTLFKSKFKHVFFTPGNHDLWILNEKETSNQVINIFGKFSNSKEKFEEILKLCSRLSIETKPKLIYNKVLIFPLFSWYEESFDVENEETVDYWSDITLFHWNEGSNFKECSTNALNYFMTCNEQNIKLYQKEIEDKKLFIISLSHFLPRREVLPPTVKLFIKFLPKVMGSTKIDQQIRTIQSHVHVFGHSHINWNQVIDGVHYVQRALKYPRERKWEPSFELEEMLIWEESNPKSNRFQQLKELQERLTKKV